MINRVTLLGRIGKKDYKLTRTGENICMLSVATNRKHVDSTGVKKEVTTWHHVNMFNRLADICNTVSSVGDIIFVEGEIVNKKIEDYGHSRIVHSVTAKEFKVISQNRIQNGDDEPNGNVKENSINSKF